MSDKTLEELNDMQEKIEAEYELHIQNANAIIEDAETRKERLLFKMSNENDTSFTEIQEIYEDRISTFNKIIDASEEFKKQIIDKKRELDETLYNERKEILENMENRKE